MVRGGTPTEQLDFYERAREAAREDLDALRSGDTRFLLADDAAGTVAYARIAGDDGAVVVLNRSDTRPRGRTFPVAARCRTARRSRPASTVGTATAGSAVAAGEVAVTLGPRSGAVLVTEDADLTPPVRADRPHRRRGQRDGRALLGRRGRRGRRTTSTAARCRAAAGSRSTPRRSEARRTRTRGSRTGARTTTSCGRSTRSGTRAHARTRCRPCRIPRSAGRISSGRRP